MKGPVDDDAVPVISTPPPADDDGYEYYYYYDEYGDEEVGSGEATEKPENPVKKIMTDIGEKMHGRYREHTGGGGQNAHRLLLSWTAEAP